MDPNKSAIRRVGLIAFAVAATAPVELHAQTMLDCTATLRSEVGWSVADKQMKAKSEEVAKVGAPKLRLMVTDDGKATVFGRAAPGKGVSLRSLHLTRWEKRYMEVTPSSMHIFWTYYPARDGRKRGLLVAQKVYGVLGHPHASTDIFACDSPKMTP